MNLSESFKSVIGSIAPVIGTALGGPVGGAAFAAISESLLGEVTTDVKKIEKALAEATPEQLAALKKVDNDFDVRMKELDINLEELAQANTANARQREIAIKDKIPAILAILVTAGFFSVLGFMLYSGTDQQSDALLVMLGALGTAWGAIMNYYFGSSAGSAKKNDMLAGLRK